MKILFRISKLGFGGAEQVFISIAREFQRQYNHKITFVVDSEDGENIDTALELGFDVVSLKAKYLPCGHWLGPRCCSCGFLCQDHQLELNSHRIDLSQLQT